MITALPTVSTPPHAARALPIAMLVQAPATAAVEDTASRETARPVQPGAESRMDPQITLPQLSGLLLTGRSQDATPPEALPAATLAPGRTQDAPADEATGVVGGFVDVPTQLTREIQKAREAYAEQGGALAVIEAMIRDLASPPGASLSVRV